jgi:ankyrin repeat protein
MALQQAWNAVQYDDILSLRSLVPSQVDPNASTHNPDNDVHTLLMWAAVHGAVQCADHLLKHGAIPDLRNPPGFTALHWSGWAGRIETVELLLAKGADIHGETNDGRTVVHIAAQRGHLQYLVDIVDRGADLQAVTSEGWTAAHFAVIGNFRDVCRFLGERNIGHEALDVNKASVYDLAAKYGRKWVEELLPRHTKKKEESRQKKQSNK